MNSPYSVVIATMDRPDALRDALRSVAQQILAPQKIIIVDASQRGQTARVVEEFSKSLPIVYQKAILKSAAMQRNQGLTHVTGELVAFADDDIVMEPDVMEKLAEPFQNLEIGGVAARMRGFCHKKPSRLLHAYYRLQAGFDHSDYGGKLFGSAINCLPCYEGQDSVEGDWLPAGLVLFRRSALPRSGFPEFEGYSFMEDVYLSATVAKTHRLLYHGSAWYDHYPSMSSAKSDRVGLARMRIRNRRRVAREVMGLDRLECESKLLLLRLFDTLHLARRHERGWMKDVFGTWTA